MGDNVIQNYIKDIKKIKILSSERQIEIINELKREDLTRTEKKSLHNELILGNLRFVISVAKNYQNRGVDLIDIISEGNIGLIKAAEKFDTNSSVKFISYAVWWVKQSITASLYDNARTIRLPSNIILEMQKNKKEENKNVDTHFFNDDELITSTLPYCIGLNTNFGEDNFELIDVIEDINAINPEDVFNIENKDEIRKNVNIVLSKLDVREKIIIEKYFGLNGIECSLEDLADEFGCTKERIRQLKDKSIKKLRNESFHLLNYL